ncbi:TMEM175 family protein [Secundilactobacillus silagei]|uniref:Membrane protein n=1 Tax=Secundilactobacillus silagei JCM 19001 TaxID=1302250 RepID=A0A1Z5IHZ7_9LACO|nr:TMEM175 family protein [Secundilactobacillus silagei]TDG72449.1 hypothetical protein C5L25_001825 [Secundilactobacillus silagei JCM 19001]GAX01258.1 membrane protein [Secundilactobacillus silagei JCM 19001]
MNKGRVEAFTDAVVAIILTIMILEFKTPESLQFSAVYENLPYFASYVVGYIFVGVAWYNHHYMFSVSKRITKKVYWMNNFWLFSTSFLPVATAWVGRGLNAFGPEAFYTIVYVIWTISYILLSRSLIQANHLAHADEAAEKIKSMPMYRGLTNWWYIVGLVILDVLALRFFPALQLVFMAGSVIFVGARSNADSDKLF